MWDPIGSQHRNKINTGYTDMEYTHREVVEISIKFFWAFGLID